MKRLFSYCLLLAALIAGAVASSADVWENFPVPAAAVFSDDSAASSDENYSFTAFETPAIPVTLNHISNPRVPTNIARNEFNPHYLIESYFSQLTRRLLSATKSTYISHYSKKDIDGYYIYALRKLLI